MHTLVIGRPGRRHFSRARTDAIRPRHTLPLLQAGPEDPLVHIRAVRAKEWRAARTGDKRGRMNAPGGWHYEVLTVGSAEWEWVRDSNVHASPAEMEEMIECYRLEAPPPHPTMGQPLGALHGCRAAVAIYPPMADVLDNDCCVCEDGMDHPGNDILECEQCKRAYHQACHSPQVEVVPAGGWLCDDCGRAGHRPSPEPARALGTLYTTSRADEACYRQFPYVIRFDDPQLDCIYTDGESRHQVRGQPSDEDRGAFIQGEIQLARPEPTGPAQTHARDREVQRELQEKCEGSLSQILVLTGSRP